MSSRRLSSCFFEGDDDTGLTFLDRVDHERDELVGDPDGHSHHVFELDFRLELAEDAFL